MVKVAFARDSVEAEMIQGLLENAGIPSALQPIGIDGPQLGIGALNPGGGSRRVVVRADRAEEARALLAEILVEDEEAWPEPINARHLDASRGHRRRDFGLVGGYARIYLWSFGLMAVAFGIFLLLRGG